MSANQTAALALTQHPAAAGSHADVTLASKRYTGPRVYVCAGCDLLDLAERNDKTTCSTACRVRAHRNGQLEVLRGVARAVGVVDERTGKPKVSLLLQAQSVRRLRPDLVAELETGRLTLAQVQPAMVRGFFARIEGLLAGKVAS